MKLSEILPSVFADGDDPEIQVTTKKYSQFPQANGPGIQGVGLKDGANVRFDLTTDAIAVNPDATFRDGGELLYDPDEIANITNQMDVNRFLASELSKLEFAGVEVSSDPPEIITDGQLWYDDDRLELFVSYQDAWISTSPLESRVEAGEALQAEILARVEAGESKQATIETNAMTKGGAQTLTDDSWSIKTGDGKTYAMIADEEITMYHVAKPDAPKQPTNKEYVDNADKKMQTDISNLEAKVTELEGSIGEHRFIYNNEYNNPRDGNFVCKNARYEITDTVDDVRYLEFGAKDVNGVPVDYSKIKAGDVLRLVGPAGERAEFNIEDVAESGTFQIDGATITGLDTLVNGIQYATTILSAFDPTGLASIQYVDTQDAKKLSLAGGTGNKMQGNLYMGGNFIAGVGEPTAGDHAATKSYADGKVAREGNNNVERNWRINHDGKNFIFFHDEGHLQLHHLAEPNFAHEAATKSYADDKVAKTGGTMTGTFSMQRQDDVSYWNYIDSKTPKAWVGGNSDEAKATQKTHGLILKIGDTNSYKQQFKITGRSNRELFKLYDDGKANANFYGNLGATEIKQDGKRVATEEYVTDAISGIEVPSSASTLPVWNKVSTAGFEAGCLSVTSYQTSTEIWVHAKSANGFEFAHPVSAGYNKTNIRWPVSVFKDVDGKREWCVSGTAWSIEFIANGNSMYYKIKIKNEDDLILRNRTAFDGEAVSIMFPPFI